MVLANPTYAIRYTVCVQFFGREVTKYSGVFKQFWPTLHITGTGVPRMGYNVGVALHLAISTAAQSLSAAAAKDCQIKA
jgi:hypothetical protein